MSANRRIQSVNLTCS